MEHMAEFRHMRASWGAEVPRSAEQFVKAAADWVGSMDYLHENPFKFTKCIYAKGSSIGKLPCTRLMYPDTSDLPKEEAAKIPEYFRETLWRVDEEAHVLFYEVEGQPLGMRNYFATKEVDPIAPDRCRATVSARFDLLTSIDSDAFVAMLHKIYRAVILGIGKKAPIN
jgi:hypothetical protein